MKECRKKKSGKRKKWLFLLLILGAIGACGGNFYKEQQKETETEEYIMTAAENQDIVSGQIAEIVGNEMTLLTESGGEELEYQIPVGTDVRTKLGTVTTFSRLAAGDNIQMLTERDGADGCILEIQITE